MQECPFICQICSADLLEQCGVCNIKFQKIRDQLGRKIKVSKVLLRLACILVRQTVHTFLLMPMNMLYVSFSVALCCDYFSALEPGAADATVDITLA